MTPLDPGDAAGVLARSSARRGRRPACPSPAPTRGPAACAASSRGRTGWRRRRRSRPTAARAARRRRGRPRPRTGRGCAARTRPRRGPCRRRSGGPGSGRRSRPSPPAPRRASPATSTPSCRTRPSVGRSRPLRCRTSVDLPLPFWPTIATDLAGVDRQVDAVERARPVRVDEPDALERRAAVIASPDQRRIEAARRAAPGASRIRDWRVDAPARSSRGSARTVVGRPVERDPAVVEDDDPAAQAVEQVGLVLRDQQRRAGRGQAAQRLADEPRPLRVELGRRLVEDEVRAVASPAARR